ncbi:amino acid adenylation domain-containing protein [Actinosynnema sp. NPDC047251]|uniref:Amino acid adenylation domain-containing protein n=1 Tax=Saccharothrix espanaensis (strain ATCC 51144 / DSM 44229 / JCM 9112 / NBRC 15066 / NRRL 15764) TaxID=1179773 RepID=K0K5E2_SACES|nr:amino acid adenylation domain-containing protein [Saccharothrix espanaensis]CCH32069.1 Amino acid adenylation domain-containing protein [Saccharothrix espanaensis DSM 44229]
MSVDSDCIHRLFERQVGPRGDAVAVVSGADRLTYRELELRANRLAHRLRALGVGPEVPVAVCVRRSTWLVVALLATLKAGGCYLPLDPAHPAERLAAMAADAGVRVLVGDGSADLDVEHVVAPDVADGPGTPPEVAGLAGDNLAYVMYTSGSTGRPKGVMVEHRNVLGLLAATRDLFGFVPRDVWTLFASAAFDVSVWEMWGALLHGCTLVIVPDEVKRSPEEFRDLLRAERVTVLNQTPAAFHRLVDLDTSGLAVRVVVFAGEELKFASLRPWFDRHGDRKPLLVNMYGITETTVHSTFRVVTAQDLGTAPGSMIGGALPTQSITLVEHEIHVGGTGVTRGYLGRPGLTAQRYLPDPDRPGRRVYRSGDTARAVGDDLQYTGRLDHQVKIRGHRIELGEVEAALRAHDGVKDAVVTALPDQSGDRRLVAYLLGEPAPDLREHLRRTLPEYMVPAVFVELDAFPLTANGKVDRAALPEPDGVRPDLAEPFAAPSTPLEKAIAEIWAEALWVDDIGLDDDFFDLGGQSLLATQVAATMRERLGVAASLRLLMDETTIRSCAKALERRS